MSINNTMRVLSTFALIAVLSTVLTSSASTPIKQFEPVYWPTRSWRSSTPEEQGMDSALLARLFEHIKDNDINLHSLLIVRNGYLVTEAYWHPYGPNDRHSVESITKSIVGTLIGIAIDRGEIESAQQRL